MNSSLPLDAFGPVLFDQEGPVAPPASPAALARPPESGRLRAAESDRPDEEPARVNQGGACLAGSSVNSWLAGRLAVMSIRTVSGVSRFCGVFAAGGVCVKREGYFASEPPGDF